MNPFYNVTANPIARTQGRSDVIRAEYAAIEAGFDGVKAQLDLKAPLNSPTFTGSVVFASGSIDATGVSSFTAPTVTPVWDATNKVATTAFVIAAIGASGTMLPPQGGFPGAFLRTNATSASWQYIVGLGLGTYQNVTSSTTLTGDVRNVDFTGAPAGTVATLPAATTLPMHTVFTMFGGVTNVGLQSPAGELLVAGDASVGQQLILTGNGTSEGSWRRVLNSLQAADLASTRHIVGQNTTLRSIAANGRGAALPIGTDRVLVVAVGSGGAGVEAYVVTAAGNSISLGSVTSVAAAGAVHWIRLLQVTGGYVVAWAASSSAQIQVSGLAVSGTTVTASAATGIGNAVASNSGLSMVDVAIEASGAAVVALYRRSNTLVEAVAATFSGSSAPTVGSAVTFAAGTDLNAGSAALASVSGGVLVGAYTCEDTSGPTQVASARVITLTGASISLGASLSLIGTLAAGHGPIAAARVTATTVLLVTKRTTGSDATAAVATISGTTLTLGGVLTWANSGDGLQASTAAIGAVGHAIDVGSGNFFVAVGASNAAETRMASLNVSGTTVTRNGASQQATQLANSRAPFSPQAGWVAYSLAGASSIFSMVPCNASGINATGIGLGVTVTSSSFARASSASEAPIAIARLQTGKRLMAVSFDSAIRAAVVQYGGAVA